MQEGKQVVYLVPTTILAQQHYNTFIQRFKDFPVRVDLMSRFRTQAQQKKTVEDLKKGLVDIVIGTHRVLSKDVGYKDLGLLIIDEEQRFGVTHKEKIKKLRNYLDDTCYDTLNQKIRQHQNYFFNPLPNEYDNIQLENVFEI
mgnify:CR=1 FL=1